VNIIYTHEREFTMPDLTNALLQKLRAHRLPGIDLGEDAQHPAYDGLSILNIPDSVCKWLGAPELPHPGLEIPELDELAQGVEQVVAVLVDAVALHRFLRWLNGRATFLQPLVDDGFLGALTSIVPSTTSAALTTLWTGHSPAEHGILGYEIFLKEYGLVANMINHAPSAFAGRPGLLYSAGLDPESFLPVTTLGPHLAHAGVEAHAFIHYSISGSGLSRMHYRDVQLHSFGSIADLWIGVRRLADQPMSKKRYIWVYYGGVDGLSHRHGPDSEQAQADFASFTSSMMENFVRQASPEFGAKTLLLLFADHGQINTHKNPHFELHNHPDFTQRLHILPTGENRLAYLYLRPSQSEAVNEYIQKTWPGSFTTVPSDLALKTGLFGPGVPAPSSPDRLGDLTVLTHGDSYMWWAEKENPLIGRHGGLSAEEMLVPLLAARLG
jgi:hypothetical protein